MPRNDEATDWMNQALAALSDPERATKAEVGLALNNIDNAIESLGENPAPAEYETLAHELSRSDTDTERCRQSVEAIRDCLRTD